MLGPASWLSGDPDAHRLASVALGFLGRAHREGAELRLRQRGNGTWTEDPSSDDAAGRALFGLGTAVTRAPSPELRLRALALFGEVSALRSEHLRVVACAALGAFELLRSEPAQAGARRLLSQAMLLLEDKEVNESWPGPEARLSYANAFSARPRSRRRS